MARSYYSFAVTANPRCTAGRASQAATLGVSSE